GDLDVGLKPLPAMTYLKFDLSNVRTKIAKAILTLTCIHPSTDGGTVYPVASSSWPEGNRPGLDSTSAKGPGLKWKDVDTNRNGQIDPRDTSPYVPDFTRPLASLGPVLPGRSYSVDVTGALASGAGSYTLVISSLKSTPGSYASRENGTAQGPLLHLVVAPSPRCGDNRVNQATEQCDGAASAACPGRCRADCTCQPLPRCGDGTLNQPSEVCDGADDSACPGRCRVDCTCAPPRCGDNLVDQAGEECDGTTSPACPGRCRTDCTCAPAPGGRGRGRRLGERSHDDHQLRQEHGARGRREPPQPRVPARARQRRRRPPRRRRAPAARRGQRLEREQRFGRPTARHHELRLERALDDVEDPAGDRRSAARSGRTRPAEPGCGLRFDLG